MGRSGYDLQNMRADQESTLVFTGIYLAKHLRNFNFKGLGMQHSAKAVGPIPRPTK